MLLGLLGQRLQELGVDLQGIIISDQLRDPDEADLVGDPELVREACGVSAHLGKIKYKDHDNHNKTR